MRYLRFVLLGLVALVAVLGVVAVSAAAVHPGIGPGPRTALGSAWQASDMPEQSKTSVYLEGTITDGVECGCHFLRIGLETYNLEGDLDGFTCGDRVGVWGTLCPTCVSICLEGTVFVVETIVGLPADSDGDTVPDSTDNCPSVATAWFVPPGDSDCDGYSSDDEGVIGTDPADACAETSDPNDEADDRWPSDFDDNQVINILDVGETLPPYFGTTVPPTGARRDLVPDGVINVLDVGMTLPPYFGYVCT